MSWLLTTLEQGGNDGKSLHLQANPGEDRERLDPGQEVGQKAVGAGSNKGPQQGGPGRLPVAGVLRVQACLVPQACRALWQVTMG